MVALAGLAVVAGVPWGWSLGCNPVWLGLFGGVVLAVTVSTVLDPTVVELADSGAAVGYDLTARAETYRAGVGLYVSLVVTGTGLLLGSDPR